MSAMGEKHLAAGLYAVLVLPFFVMSFGCPADDQADQDAGTDAGIDAGPTTLSFTATLNAAQEVPPTSAVGTGTGEFTFFFDGGTLVYTITHNQSGAGVGHIHRGHAGVNGPVIHPFANVTSPITGTFVLDGGTAGQDFQDLTNGRLYVNLHAPGGTPFLIRGQILRPGEQLFVAGLVDQGLSDADGGVAAVVLSADKSSIGWNVTLTTLDGGDPITNAHVHNLDGGGVLIPITFANLTPDGGSGSDPVPNPGAAAELESEHTYFNIHTSSVPAGRLRGDLRKK